MENNNRLIGKVFDRLSIIIGYFIFFCKVKKTFFVLVSNDILIIFVLLFAIIMSKNLKNLLSSVTCTSYVVYKFTNHRNSNPANNFLT